MFSRRTKIIIWTILAAVLVAIILKIRKKKMKDSEQELSYTGGGITPAGHDQAADLNPIQPVTGRISGTFGESRPGHTHKGVDVAVASGTPILSPWNGTIIDKWNDIRYGGGLSLKIKHDNGYTTGYCHLSSYPANIEVGTKVYAGDVVAYSGATGWSCSGAHLHFSLCRTATPLQKIDPLVYGFDFK